MQIVHIHHRSISMETRCNKDLQCLSSKRAQPIKTLCCNMLRTWFNLSLNFIRLRLLKYQYQHYNYRIPRNRVFKVLTLSVLAHVVSVYACTSIDALDQRCTHDVQRIGLEVYALVLILIQNNREQLWVTANLTQSVMYVYFRHYLNIHLKHNVLTVQLVIQGASTLFMLTTCIYVFFSFGRYIGIRNSLTSHLPSLLTRMWHFNLSFKGWNEKLYISITPILNKHKQITVT